MISFLELPYRGGLNAVKNLLKEIGLSPVHEREQWPVEGDVFLTSNRYELVFIKLDINEVGECFFIFSSGTRAADWIESKGGYKLSYDDALDEGYISGEDFYNNNF